MRLQNLSLVNFKNYAETHVAFPGDIICLLGRNGSGKTNLLEAIHYLSFARAFANADAQNQRSGQEGFAIKGVFNMGDRISEVSCSYLASGKKVLAENGKEYGRFSGHLGKYPLVLVAPNDIELIWDGPDLRRKFFDTLLSQTNREYLEALISYQANLRSRNASLRMFSERGSVDDDLLQSYNRQLVSLGSFIHSARSSFVRSFAPILAGRYHFLASGTGEDVDIAYQSDLNTSDFSEMLSSHLQRDIALGRTTVGVHRDDFIFRLNGLELKRIGSQGQQKTLLIGLKLAEFEVLHERLKIKPILLLDDIFDKLDDERIDRLMTLTSDGSFGQIFLTDARPERTREAMARAGARTLNLVVESGKIIEMADKAVNQL